MISLDIVAFLSARLDEDEAAAKAWLPLGNPDAAARPHIARQDPGRVLREVEAGRRLLMAYGDALGWLDDYESEECDWDISPERQRDWAQWYRGAVEGLRAAVSLRAATWSGHPDYDATWSPDFNGGES